MKKLLGNALVVVCLLSFSFPAFSGDAPDLITAIGDRGANADAVAALIARGADVNKRGPYGVTPLMVAAEKGQTETVRLLLEKGADPYVVVWDGRGTALSAYDLAMVKGHRETAQLLPAIGADGKPLAGGARERHAVELVEDAMKTRLARVSATMDPFKVALAMYYQELGAFPGKPDSVDTARSGKPSPAGSVWGLVGFSVYPVLPREVASVAYVPFGVTKEGGATSFGLIVTLANVKPGSVDGQLLGISPSSDMVITGPASARSSGRGLEGASTITWYYSCHQVTQQPFDSVAAKLFANGAAPLVCD